MEKYREKITEYISKTYGAKIENPWGQYPEHTTFKDTLSDKWFALIMRVNKHCLGDYAKKAASEGEYIDVINVKADSEFIYEISKKAGFMPGYHMNKQHWLTIFLDGTVELDHILDCIDISFQMVTDSPTRRIYEAVKKIPKGHVATYGQVAELAGNKKMSRAVGNALHKNPDPGSIPCFRVVNSKGELSGAFAFGGAQEQAKRLETDGIEVTDGKVNLEVYGIEITDGKINLDV